MKNFWLTGISLFVLGVLITVLVSSFVNVREKTEWTTGYRTITLSDNSGRVVHEMSYDIKYKVNRPSVCEEIGYNDLDVGESYHLVVLTTSAAGDVISTYETDFVPEKRFSKLMIV